MTSEDKIYNLITAYEYRQNVASMKVKTGYRKDYNDGVAFAYKEVMQDLKRLLE